MSANPFSSDPDRSAIWTMLVERDIDHAVRRLGLHGKLGIFLQAFQVVRRRVFHQVDVAVQSVTTVNKCCQSFG